MGPPADDSNIMMFAAIRIAVFFVGAIVVVRAILLRAPVDLERLRVTDQGSEKAAILALWGLALFAAYHAVVTFVWIVGSLRGFGGLS